MYMNYGRWHRDRTKTATMVTFQRVQSQSWRLLVTLRRKQSRKCIEKTDRNCELFSNRRGFLKIQENRGNHEGRVRLDVESKCDSYLAVKAVGSWGEFLGSK